MFCHLRVHSEYSLLSGAVRIEEALSKAKELGMPALGISDYGNIFGGVELFLAAKKAGIQPVLGCTVLLPSFDDHRKKQFQRNVDSLWELVLIVTSQAGYHNLCQLLTTSYLEGFYYKPRLDTEMLRQHAGGLIALSGGFGGETNFHLHNHDETSARNAAQKYAAIFPGRFYLELQDNDLPGQKGENEALITIANKVGIPIVATGNVHYMERGDAEAFEILRGIQLVRQQNTPHDHAKFTTDGYFFKSSDEVAADFFYCPEALHTSGEIASACNFEFDFKTYHFPKFEIPPGLTLDEVLEAEARQGLSEQWEAIKLVGHIGEDKRKLYDDRLTLELEVIKKMGFSGYFLIVSDFIRWAKGEGIPVGPGRGSGAGSLTAYCLRITNLDPLPYNLLFERFLNPERISMPDFDIDFCQDRRSEVIQYVGRKYGHVSQIITFGKMKARAVVRDVGRVLDLPYDFVDKIAKLIPGTLNMTLTQALKDEDRLKDLYDSDPTVKRLLDISLKLEGLSRHASTHAAGVIITDRPLSEFVPLYRGSNEDVVTQFDMKCIEKIGLIKFDFLGLKTLTVIHKAIQNIKTVLGEDVDITRIPLDDPAVYKLLSSGDGCGIFQLESSGMRDLMVRLDPGTFEDIIALIALYRPGPLGSGMVDDFIERKKGKRAIVYELPQLEPILKDTYGVIVYQEQVMQIASKLANYSLGEADLLRRAMGKKKAEEMAAQRKRFLAGAVAGKIDTAKAEKIFDLMAKFAEYGFNKSHSAAYALISYQTAYLKTHFPDEYMAALLSTEMQDTDKLPIFINDCRARGIRVLPPDVNESGPDFKVVGRALVRYGLFAIKGAGEAAVTAIVAARRAGQPFSSLFDFCARVDQRRVTKKVIEVLVKAGAFDFTGVGRRSLTAAIPQAALAAANKQRDRETGQNDLFDALGGVGPVALGGGLPVLEDWSKNELLKFEKEAFGFYFSSHPLNAFEDVLSKVASHQTSDLSGLGNQTEVSLGGTIATSRVIKTKAGENMAFITVEDLQGAVEVIVFPKVYKKCADLITCEEPLIVKGTVDRGEESVKVLATGLSKLSYVLKTTTRSIHLDIPYAALTHHNIERALDILGRFSGDSAVYLHVKKPHEFETVIEMPHARAMACEPLQHHLNQLFAAKVVRFS